MLFSSSGCSRPTVLVFDVDMEEVNFPICHICNSIFKEICYSKHLITTFSFLLYLYYDYYIVDSNVLIIKI